MKHIQLKLRIKNKNAVSSCFFHFFKRYISTYELLLGPRFLPKDATTLTKRRLYWILRLARPVFDFLFSFFSTLGVWPLTLPARDKDPWTLPGEGEKHQTFIHILQTPLAAHSKSQWTKLQISKVYPYYYYFLVRLHKKKSYSPPLRATLTSMASVFRLARGKLSLSRGDPAAYSLTWKLK